MFSFYRLVEVLDEQDRYNVLSKHGWTRNPKSRSPSYVHPSHPTHTIDLHPTVGWTHKVGTSIHRSGQGGIQLGSHLSRIK